MLEHAVAVIATMLAGGFLLPQIVRLVRRRDTSGVAPTWAVFGLVTNAAWVFYLGILDLWLAAIAPGLAMVSYGVIVRLVVPGVGRARSMILPACYALGLAAIGLFGGPAQLGISLAVVPAAQLVPQISTVWRAHCPTGVSPLTWILSIGEAALWMSYGMMIGDIALIGYGLVTSIGSGLVLGGWWMALRWQPIRPRSVAAFPQSSGELMRTP